MIYKKLIYFSFVLIFFISFISAVPRIEPYVNDYADLLTNDEELKLNLLSDIIEINTTYEIALITVLNTEGQDRLEYANKIGDENGVGKLDKDNGVVVLYSLENERGGAIATGRGSESIFNDAKVGRIGREAKPLCDDERYYECFEFIITELKKEIVNSTADINTTDESSDLSNSGVIFIIAIIIVMIIIGIVSSSDNDSSSGSYVGSSGSYKGGFGGGSSFGGGSFGGGGGKF
jgi:uncharacterized protein